MRRPAEVEVMSSMAEATAAAPVVLIATFCASACDVINNEDSKSPESNFFIFSVFSAKLQKNTRLLQDKPVIYSD